MWKQRILNMKKKVLVYCRCSAGIISEQKQNDITLLMQKSNTDVVELHDLCAFTLNEKEKLAEINAHYEQKTIIACYPRAIANMFRQNKIEMENYEVVNFREKNPEELGSEIDAEITEDTGNSTYTVIKNSLEVPAWYPVIDESRCIYCAKCARFCVFGVYKFSKKSLEVVEPLNCKNNCPACGRTCPTSAIIFPRLKENSVLSGAEPGTNETKTATTGQGGLFVMLNERNSSRRNIFKQDMMQLAEDEKRKAIEELKKRAGEKK